MTILSGRGDFNGAVAVRARDAGHQLYATRARGSTDTRSATPGCDASSPIAWTGRRARRAMRGAALSRIAIALPARFRGRPDGAEARRPRFPRFRSDAPYARFGRSDDRAISSIPRA